MGRNSTKILMFSAVAVVINVVLGMITSALSIPFLFLDAMGTVFIAASFGVGYGVMTGVVTNLVLGITSGPTAIPFALVSIAIAIVVGLMAKNGFSIGKAIITGIILGIICPAIGTTIRMLFFEGLTGSGTDLVILALRASGQEMFTATFLSTIGANMVDKILSCVLVSILLKQSAVKKMTFK